MFSNLSEKLDKALQVLKGHGSITEINVAETLKEVRRALLDADVNFKTARDFTQRVKEKAIGQDVLTNLKPGQLMVKIVKDELAELMGGATSEINLKDKPAIVLMSGLQGSGKTTFTAKLANDIRKKKSLKPLMVACDVYRPAAIEQLHVLGKDLDIEVYSEIQFPNIKLTQNPISKNGIIKLVNTKGYESFELFTLTGQSVQISSKFHSGITEIFSNNLTSGIYLLRSRFQKIDIFIQTFG